MSNNKDKKNKNDVFKANKPAKNLKKNKDICHHCDKEGQ